LGQALLNAGEIDESLEVLGGVVRSAPGSARGHAELGAAQLQKRDFEAAKGSYESVLRLDPTYAAAHFGLATACARLGLVEQAREHEAKFREFRSDRQQALRGARLAYDDVQALYVDLAQRYTEMAAVYLAEGRLAPAEQLWRRAARMHPENRECRQALAWLFLQQNKPWETILMLRELARLEPANISYPAEIARLYGRLDRPDDAERTLQDYAQSSPDSAAGQTALADFYLNVKKEPALAVQHARKAVDISGAADHWYLLSAAQEVAGDLPAAVAALERAAQLAPENAQYRQLLALSKSRAAATDSGQPGKTRPASTETGASKSGTTSDKAPNQRD
jgi:tetratricopeptide (TPR) repeat protein